MIKKLMKYFLPLSIVLFLGYNLVYANTKEGCSLNSLNDGICLTNFIQDSSTNNFTSSFEVKKEAFKICTSDNEELEEDELKPLKKEVKSIPYFSSNLYAQKRGSLWYNTTKRVFLHKHLEFFSSNKWYILFRVFRI